MANGHGGARPGAGRKRKAEKFAGQIDAAERKIADKLPKLVGNMLRLANGGIEVTHVEYERDEKTGRMVIVKSRTEKTLPDRKANEYLIDRILGKPLAEVDLTTNGEALGLTVFSRLSDDELDREIAAIEGGETPPDLPDPA